MTSRSWIELGAPADPVSELTPRVFGQFHRRLVEIKGCLLPSSNAVGLGVIVGCLQDGCCLRDGVPGYQRYVLRAHSQVVQCCRQCVSEGMEPDAFRETELLEVGAILIKQRLAVLSICLPGLPTDTS